LTLLALGTAIISASSNSESQTSGALPSIIMTPNAKLIAGQAVPLSSLITLQSIPTGSVGTAIFVDPSPTDANGVPLYYTLEGGYTYPADSASAGIVGGALSGNGAQLSTVGAPSWLGITVTANGTATGSITLAGGVSSETIDPTTGEGFITGGPWSFTFPVQSCGASASVASASPGSDPAPSCSPQCVADLTNAVHPYLGGPYSIDLRPTFMGADFFPAPSGLWSCRFRLAASGYRLANKPHRSISGV
jgi:hypothetical protein